MSPAFRPNLLLVSLDSVRADRLSAYGYGRPTSPNLAALAAEAVRWDRAYSATHWTLPAHTSMLTGAAFCYHRVGADGGPKRLADPTLTTLPELLRAAGYRTAAFTNCAYLSHETCFDRGFEQLRWTEETVSRASPLYDASILGKYWGRWLNGLYQRHLYRRRDRGGAATTRRAAAWLRERAREEAPFFAFVHLMDAHSPYAVPPSYARRFVPGGDVDLTWLRDHVRPWYHRLGVKPLSPEQLALAADVYDGAVRYVDAMVGRLIEQLGRAGRLDDTVIVVTADHGESLGERGALGHGGDVLYEPVVRVPLLLRPPGGGSARSSSDLVSHLDLVPTIARAVGISLEPLAAQVHGRDLFGDPRPEAERGDHRTLVVECLTAPPRRLTGVDRELPSIRYHTTAVIQSTHKLLIGSDGRPELYDLARDPGESDDLAARRPDLVARLEQAAESWTSAHQPPAAVVRPAVERGYGPFVTERLRALGYLE